MGSGTHYLGYRPSEERLRNAMKELIDKHIIVKLEINVNRDCVHYWYQNSKPLKSSGETRQ